MWILKNHLPHVARAVRLALPKWVDCSGEGGEVLGRLMPGDGLAVHAVAEPLMQLFPVEAHVVHDGADRRFGWNACSVQCRDDRLEYRAGRGEDPQILLRHVLDRRERPKELAAVRAERSDSERAPIVGAQRLRRVGGRCAEKGAPTQSDASQATPNEHCQRCHGTVLFVLG